MAKITYDLVSMAGILRDYVSPKYLNREHQFLVDIADSLYNTGINPKEFKAEYRDLYDQYGKSFWDKVLADMSAIDGQIYDNRGASDLFADYQDRIGDADFYEDYYDPYKGPSDGYGVYSYRNGQEDSYTYAENYDEALKYAKWDLTHKNYIDVVRIIDNATGEIVDEFDSLDSIGEGCSPRRKSKKKKIVTQGCSSKEGCGSKRRVAKEDSYYDRDGDNGRYVIGKDFNTKDWFIYDNVTDKNFCWCDTEEEAIEIVKTLPGYDQKSESYKREGIGVGVKDAGKYYELVDYFDVWGNEEDGWEVNDQTVWDGADDIYMSADTTDTELIDYLKSIRYLDDNVKESDLYIDWGDGDFIEIFKADDMMPICCLRLNEYSRK